MVGNGIRFMTYVSSLLDNSFFLFYFVFQLTDIFFDLLTILLFFLVYYKNPFLKKFYNFSLSLPLKNLIFLTMFTLTISVPTKIWVNHNLSPFFVSFTAFLLLFISRFMPMFFFFFLLICFTMLQSYVIMYFYEKEGSFFRKKLDSFLFSDDEFSKEYIYFFLGDSGGILGKMISPTTKGVAAIIIETLFRNRERKQLNNTVEKEFKIYIENSDTKPKTALESLEIQKNIQKQVDERDGVIIPLENRIKNGLDKFFDWFG